MQLLRTTKDAFDAVDILKAIEDHETKRVPKLTSLWRYYKANDPKIMDREAPDANNPDNKTVVSYGRKLVNTFKGYAFRPGYVTYKSDNEALADDLAATFQASNEPVRTSRSGRNIAIFGYTYELLYTRSVANGGRSIGMPLFINVDPRTMVVYYNYEPDPRIVVAIRYYSVTKDLYKVEAYYADRIEYYDRARTDSGEWRLLATGSEEHYFGEVPVAAYYMGDEAMGIIEPVQTLIDDFDLLTSDSMNEFDRFSNAYLILKKMSITPQAKRESQSFNKSLRLLKRRRVFENVPSDGDVKFLLKDTPTAFIQWLADHVREEIHKQSHVPDFMSERLGGDISGVAVARMMFDFENLVSSAEGDFNIGLNDRIRLITNIYDLIGLGGGGTYTDVTISHKRNVPQNVKEFAEIGVLMKQAGFSQYLIADIMPNDIVPDVEEELRRQREERESMFMDMPMPDEE